MADGTKEKDRSDRTPTKTSSDKSSSGAKVQYVINIYVLYYIFPQKSSDITKIKNPDPSKVNNPEPVSNCQQGASGVTKRSTKVRNF